jgi:hypothetical protein
MGVAWYARQRAMPSGVDDAEVAQPVGEGRAHAASCCLIRRISQTAA